MFLQNLQSQSIVFSETWHPLSKSKTLYLLILNTDTFVFTNSFSSKHTKQHRIFQRNHRTPGLPSTPEVPVLKLCILCFSIHKIPQLLLLHHEQLASNPPPRFSPWFLSLSPLLLVEYVVLSLFLLCYNCFWSRGVH